MAETLKKRSKNAVNMARVEKALTEKGYLRREIALYAGKSRSAVINDLRLLSLDLEVLSLKRKRRQQNVSRARARAYVHVVQ